MFENKKYIKCQATESSRFWPLKGEKWIEVKSNDLAKVIWKEDIILYNSCYMCFIDNLLRRGIKWTRITEEKVSNTKFEFYEAVKRMAKILYENEYIKQEGSIYEFDTMQKLLKKIDPALKDFFQQLYLVA